MITQNLKNNHYFGGSKPHLNTVIGLIGTGSVEGAMSAGATAYSIPQIDDKLQEQGFSEEVRQAKLINFGLGLLSLGVGGNMPTEYKLIQGVDNISTGYESFKEYLNKPETYIQYGIGDGFIQDDVKNYIYRDDYAKAIKDISKGNINSEAEIGHTVAFGLAAKVTSGMARDVNGNTCKTHTFCLGLGAIAEISSNASVHTNSGILSNNSSSLFGTVIVGTTLGVGIGSSGSVAKDGSVSVGFEGKAGLGTGAAVLICKKETKECFYE